MALNHLQPTHSTGFMLRNLIQATIIGIYRKRYGFFIMVAEAASLNKNQFVVRSELLLWGVAPLPPATQPPKQIRVFSILPAGSAHPPKKSETSETY